MLKDMTSVRTYWSEQDDREMVTARRLADRLINTGIPAATGRDDNEMPVVRIHCSSCNGWFTPLLDLPSPFTCDDCYKS